MTKAEIRETLIDRYNESVEIPPEVSVDLPALVSPRSPRPTAEEWETARRQVVKMLIVLVLMAAIVAAVSGIYLAIELLRLLFS